MGNLVLLHLFSDEYNKLDKSDFCDCCATKSRSKPNGCKK